MAIPTLLRQEEHSALARLRLEGSVLDLGGDKKGEYLSHLGSKVQVTTLNLDPKTHPDILHDLEVPLPVSDNLFDHVLLINVLEHIYDYRQLLSEAVRVVRPGGSIVVVIPFLFPLHPSPDDFRRFSANALKREIEAAGAVPGPITALGTGVFSARYVLLDRLMPAPIRFASRYLSRPFVRLADATFTSIARLTKRKYSPDDYALGFCVQATKH